MRVLGVDRRAAGAHCIFDVLASLVVPGELLDQFDRSGVARRRVAPSSSGSHRFAVDLISHGTMDHVEVLLRQSYVGFPRREQLGVGGPGRSSTRRQTEQTYSAVTFYSLEHEISEKLQDLSGFLGSAPAKKQNRASGVDIKRDSVRCGADAPVGRI